MGAGPHGGSRTTTGHASQTFVKTMLKKKAITMWREEIVRRCKGRRVFRVPREEEVPRIPPGLRGAPKEVASRFFQLASGHAMIAPILGRSSDGLIRTRAGGAAEAGRVESICSRNVGLGRKR